MKHIIKCHQQYFERLLDGTKTCEVRRNDRDYQVGDILEIDELSFGSPTLTTGRTLYFEVTHILADINYVKPNYVVMSLKEVKR